jgi:acyl-CoA thioesterase-1
MTKRLLAVFLLFGACSKAPEAPVPTSEPAVTNRRVILFLGDSLTAGYGIAAQDAYPALLAARWQLQKRPLVVRNAGVSGSTTAGILENLDWNLQDDVALVFLAIGGNDGLRGRNLKETERDLEAIVRRIQAQGAKVVIAGQQIPPNYGPKYAAEFSELYIKVARRTGVPRLPFLLAGVAGRPAYNIVDGIHPNERGHKIMADTVETFLNKQGLLR